MAAQNCGNTVVRGRPFQKGDDNRRNTGGRPKKDQRVTEMLTKACPEAVQLLIDTMTDEEAKPELRVQCANTIIDRVMGKAAQPIKADVYKAETPLTLDEMFTIAEEVLHEAGGPDAP